MPAPPVIVPAGGQLRLIWSLGTVVAYNVIGINNTSNVAFTQTIANTLDSAIKTSFGTTWGTVAGTACSLSAVGIKDLRTAANAEFVGAGAAVAGAATGDILPKGVAYVVTLRTAKAGASFRGRVYLPGVTESNNDATGSPSTTVGTMGVNFVNGIRTALQGSNLELAVISRPAYATKTVKDWLDSTNAVIFSETHSTKARNGAMTPVTAVSARNFIWDSQRRRTAAGSVSTFSQPMAQVFFTES